MDYTWNDRVLAMQTALLRAISAPPLLARMRESESRVARRATACRSTSTALTRLLWGEVGGAAPAAIKALDGTGTRRELQRAYVDRLAQHGHGRRPACPTTPARWRGCSCTRIDARASRTLLLPALGDNTRAHLLETRARIKRDLEASTQAEDAASAPRGTGAPGR